MRYLLMMTVPLLSLRFTTLAVSRKLDRRSECDEELAEPREWGGVRLPDLPPPSALPAPSCPSCPPAPLIPVSPRPLPGLRLEGLRLDCERERNGD